MKLGTTIALCAVSAIGTAIALDKVTEGAVRDVISDILIDRGLDMADDFDDFVDENFDVKNVIFKGDLSPFFLTFFVFYDTILLKGGDKSENKNT